MIGISGHDEFTGEPAAQSETAHMSGHLLPTYLSTVDVLGVHAVLLKKYGGAKGMRDMGAVESAVFRPQCGYYTDMVEEAAALLESLLINHPFMDGNKRTAFAACDVFLRINGSRIQAENNVFMR